MRDDTTGNCHSRLKVLCCNSPVALEKAFNGDFTGFIRSCAGGADYLVLSPNSKSSNELLALALRQGGLPDSLPQSNFLTIKQLCRELMKECGTQKRTVSRTCCIEILKEVVTHQALTSFESIKGFHGLYDNLYDLIIKFKEAGHAPRTSTPGRHGIPEGHINAAFLRVFEKYDEYLEKNNFFDEADVLLFAKDAAASSQKLSKVTALFITGFVHLSGFEEAFLANLVKSVNNARLYMLYTKDDKHSARYSHLGGFIASLQKNAGADITNLTGDDNDLSGNLGYIKKNIFLTYDGKDDFDAGDDSIQIIAAESADDEVDFCARTVKSLVRSKGYKYNDIAVVARGLNGYTERIVKRFDRYGISADLTRSLPAVNLNVIKTAMLPLYLTQRDFRREDLMSFLRSGYIARKSEIDINKVELHLINAGIVIGAENYPDKLQKYLNTLRQSSKDADSVLHTKRYLKLFIGEVTEAIPRRATVKGYKESLLALLQDRYMIKERMVSGLRDTAPELVKRDIAAYIRFSEAFDEIAAALALLGRQNKEVGIDEMISLLTGQLQTKSVTLDNGLYDGAAPDTGVNAIKFYSPEEFFASPYKVVFLLNMTDGVFPKRVTPSFLLGGRGQNYKFLPDNKAVVNNEKLFFYRALALCSERCYITYCENGADSGFSTGLTPAARSPFIDDITLLLEGGCSKRTIKQPSAMAGEPPTANRVDILRNFFGEMAGRCTSDQINIFNFLVSHDDTGHFQRVFKNTMIERKRAHADSFTRYEGNLSQEGGFINGKITDLFRGKVFSPSQLDTFANCPVSYFFARVLCLTPIEPVETALPARDKGTILHDILFLYYSSLKEMTQSEPLFYPKDYLSRCELLEKTADGYFKETADLYARINPRIMELEQKLIINMLKGFIKFECDKRDLPPENKRAYNRAVKEGYFFEPAYFELGFGANRDKGGGADKEPFVVELSDGNKISIRGYIDRIDVSESGGLFVVIDYKSGSYPSNADVKRGVSFQMPVYSEYVKRVLLKGYEPACGKYYKLKSPAGAGIITVTLEDVMELLTQNIKMMKAGEFFVAPKKCNPWCDFSSICRYDKSVSEMKAGKRVKGLN